QISSSYSLEMDLTVGICFPPEIPVRSHKTQHAGDQICASGASVVAIDNKIEQAMDLVKSHLMYAVREEVEVLKEHIKELYERNSVLERENAVLKSLANTDQLGQLSSQLTQGSSTSPPLQQQQQHPLVTNNNNTPLVHHEGSQSVPHQPNITSA
uniref:TSC22 domain family protein 2 n=1 Tax=Dicentrarchus labrax TaxID=13489 RepID=A0A8C4DXH1_DICLA